MDNKKGAMELSMTTIIIIVLGVTLLILGITFIRGMMAKVVTLSDEAFTTAEKEIQGKMGASDKFYVSGLNFEVASGKKVTISTGIQNFGMQGEINKFKVEAIPGEGASADWFTIPEEQAIEVGDVKGIPMVISMPAGTEPGSVFSFTLTAYKDGNPYDSESMLVTVKE